MPKRHEPQNEKEWEEMMLREMDREAQANDPVWQDGGIREWPSYSRGKGRKRRKHAREVKVYVTTDGTGAYQIKEDRITSRRLIGFDRRADSVLGDQALPGDLQQAAENNYDRWGNHPGPKRSRGRRQPKKIS